MSTKRVTVTVELVDHTGRTTWAHTETAEHSTGDNPRFHVDDVDEALGRAGLRSLDVVRSRFGSPPPPPTAEELKDQAAARAAARLRKRALLGANPGRV